MHNGSTLLTKTAVFGITLISLSVTLNAQGTDTTVTLPTLYIESQETANTQPVATYETPISNLEFDPRIDLQSRNMAEAQGDVSIRGGIFENTGFRLGAATLFDPQTGHYFAELPIAPEMLEGPRVYTGVDNALYGFNSSVGTIDYNWRRIHDGGAITVGAGNNDLNFQRVYGALTGQINESAEWHWGVEGDYSRSESDGTIDFGDHDFERVSARAQVQGPNSQTDFIAGYQEKNFSWPNMYTPPVGAFFGAIEYERLKTRLFIANHRQSYSEDSFVELTAYHRRHTDDYLLDAVTFDFPIAHETKVSSTAISGFHELNEPLGIHYTAQYTADEIESTSLEQGDFTSRNYIKVSLLPQYQISMAEGQTITLRAGVSFDETNRNSSEWSPLADITWQRTDEKGYTIESYLSYSESTQLPGYTAIGGSETGGVFRSNHDLKRETSQNIEWGLKMNQGDWSFDTAVFYRWDNDLVDWTYSSGSPFARAADNVDIETFGLELIGTRRWGQVEGIASYTFLDKTEDFADETIDASFYALNFAKHRITIGAIWNPHENLQIRIDNEWREQEPNELRGSDDSAFFTHLGASYFPPQIQRLEIFISIDNLWDDDFEEVPGTPGRGDQYAAGLTWSW